MFTDKKRTFHVSDGVKLSFLNGLMVVALVFVVFGGLFAQAESVDENVDKTPMVFVDGVEGHSGAIEGVDEQDVVSINTATADELASVLFGVGLKKAQAIVEWRELNGHFSVFDELVQVKGIGAKTIERNLSKMTL